MDSTSKSLPVSSSKQPEPNQPKLEHSKQPLIALIDNGPIEMELLKKSAKECLLKL